MAVLLAAAGAAAPSRAAGLRLKVVPSVGKESLELNAVRYRNAHGETFSISRLSYLLSGVALQRQDGSWFTASKSIGWLNAATNRDTLILDNVPAGGYRSLRFFVGINPADNAADPASRPPDHPLNPNLNGLHWSWQGGYIFMALEGLYRAADGSPLGFAYHLARDPFRTEIVVAGDFEVSEESEVTLRFDLAAVFAGSKPISFANDGATTHSRDGDPVAVALQTNLAAAFTLVSPNAKSTSRPSSAAQQTKPDANLLQFGSHFPAPALPADNPLIAERVALGRALFRENALSRDGTLSCASCHLSTAALSDPRPFSLGIEGRTGTRNAMPLFNLAWKKSFFWDGRATSLRSQVLMPITDHQEMDESIDRVVEKLKAKDHYPKAFKESFGSPDITADRIGLSLENFLLTLTSDDSKFDQAQRGEVQLTADEQRGFELFMMEREPRMGVFGADCFHCHGGALFTDHQFRNNGLPLSDRDPGRFGLTKISIDRGAFATPSLRNIALTAPYMHDGRFQTLEQVVDHYSEGVQRTDTLDPNLAKHPNGGLHLAPEEKKAVIAFLKTLTDERFAKRALTEP